jgi:hypothetical protein
VVPHGSYIVLSVTDSGFGTVCSALIALPAVGSGLKPVWRFAAGLPGTAPFDRVAP